MIEIRGGLFFNQSRRDFSFFKDLMLQVIFMVVAELWMESQAEQSVRPAFVEQFLVEIREERFCFASRDSFPKARFYRFDG